jgi:hypothetical protein
VKTTLILKDEILRQAKKRAAELGLSLSAFTERLLRDALAERREHSRPITLPTFGHTLPPYDHSLAQLKALENED